MRILIVEDESVAARGLERAIRELAGSRIVSLKVLGSFTAAEYFIQDNPIDLLFLDLQLHERDGFELLTQLAADSFQTIVVSANTDRAIEAFEYGVLDFLPKPLDRQRLKQAMDRFDSVTISSGRNMKYLSIRKDDRAELIDLSRVEYLRGGDNYAMIHISGGALERHRKTLDSFSKILPGNFLRIHKSCIVNLDYAVSIRTSAGSRYELELKTGENIPVGRTFYGELKQRTQK